MYNTDSESRTVANVCRCRPIRTKSRQNEMSNITYPPEKFPRKKIQEFPPSADSAPARAPAGVMGPAPWGNFGPPSANSSFSIEELMFLNASYNLQKTK